MFCSLTKHLLRYRTDRACTTSRVIRTLKEDLERDLQRAFELSEPLIRSHYDLFRNSNTFFDFLVKLADADVPPVLEGEQWSAAELKRQLKACEEELADCRKKVPSVGKKPCEEELADCRQKLRECEARLTRDPEGCEIERLRAELRERDETVGRLQAELRERDETVGRLQAELCERDETLQAELREKDETLRAELRRKDETLREKDETVWRLQTELREKEAELRASQCDDRAKRDAQTTLQRQTYESLLDEERKTTAAANVELDRLRTTHRLCKERLRQVEGQLTDAEARIADLRKAEEETTASYENLLEESSGYRRRVQELEALVQEVPMDVAPDPIFDRLRRVLEEPMSLFDAGYSERTDVEGTVDNVVRFARKVQEVHRSERSCVLQLGVLQRNHDALLQRIGNLVGVLEALWKEEGEDGGVLATRPDDRLVEALDRLRDRHDRHLATLKKFFESIVALLGPRPIFEEPDVARKTPRVLEHVLRAIGEDRKLIRELESRVEHYQSFALTITQITQEEGDTKSLQLSVKNLSLYKAAYRTVLRRVEAMMLERETTLTEKDVTLQALEVVRFLDGLERTQLTKEVRSAVDRLAQKHGIVAEGEVERTAELVARLDETLEAHRQGFERIWESVGRLAVAHRHEIAVRDTSVAARTDVVLAFLTELDQNFNESAIGFAALREAVRRAMDRCGYRGDRSEVENDVAFLEDVAEKTDALVAAARETMPSYPFRADRSGQENVLGWIGYARKRMSDFFSPIRRYATERNLAREERDDFGVAGTIFAYLERQVRVREDEIDETYVEIRRVMIRYGFEERDGKLSAIASFVATLDRRVTALFREHEARCEKPTGDPLSDLGFVLTRYRWTVELLEKTAEKFGEGDAERFVRDADREMSALRRAYEDLPQSFVRDAKRTKAENLGSFAARQVELLEKEKLSHEGVLASLRDQKRLYEEMVEQQKKTLDETVRKLTRSRKLEPEEAAASEKRRKKGADREFLESFSSLLVRRYFEAEYRYRVGRRPFEPVNDTLKRYRELMDKLARSEDLETPVKDFVLSQLAGVDSYDRGHDHREYVRSVEAMIGEAPEVEDHVRELFANVLGRGVDYLAAVVEKTPPRLSEDASGISSSTAERPTTLMTF